jgi:hypothetical protein
MGTGHHLKISYCFLPKEKVAKQKKSPSTVGVVSLGMPLIVGPDA